MLSASERSIACWVLLATITIGYIVPGLSEIFAPYAFFALFSMIILSLLPMARLDVEDIFTLDKRVWQVVCWQLFVLPSIILSTAVLLKIHSSITMLIMVSASAGSLFASPTFAELLKLDRRRAVQCMIISTFVMPVSYFIFFELVLQTHMNLDMGNFMMRCVTFLVLPMGMFLVYMGYARSLPLHFVEKVEGLSRRLTILALMIFGVGILGPAREMLYFNPSRFFMLLGIVTVLGAGMAWITAVVMFKQGITDALTASIVSGFRNVGLGFVLLPGVLSDETSAYIGISQIPIFLAPLVVSFLVRNHQPDTDAASLAAA
jgi:hypothetical protein